MVLSFISFEYHEGGLAMTDGCGRTIDYLRLSVTDLCNYRCR